MSDIVELLRGALMPPIRPTVHELEQLLSDPDSPPLVINPDGSIGLGTVVTISRADLDTAIAAIVELRDEVRRRDDIIAAHAAVDEERRLQIDTLREAARAVIEDHERRLSGLHGSGEPTTRLRAALSHT